MAKRVKVKRSRSTKSAKPTKAKTAKPATKKKRKLSTTPEAKRARARRAEAKRAAELAAAKRSRAAKKAAKTRRRRRLEEESAELGELERRREEAEAAERRREGDERQLLIDVLEDMRSSAAGEFPISLSLTEAEIGARVPWLVVGRFDPVDAITYAELAIVFALWRDDLVLEARIHPQRLSQIRLVYSDPNAKRGESDSIVSHVGPWESVISEIVHELVGSDLEDPDEDSLAARYRESTVPSFYVYFSGRLATEVEISL